MNKGLFVKFAEWFESHHLSIAQNIGPTLLTIVVLWVSFWAPEAWNAFNNLNNPSTKDIILHWVFQWTPWLFLVSACIALYGGWAGAIDAKNKNDEIIKLKKSLSETVTLSNELEEAQLAIDDLRVQHAETVYSVTSDYLGHLLTDHLDYNDTERASLYLHRVLGS